MAQYRAITEGFDLYNGVEAGVGLGVASLWTMTEGSLVTGRFGGQAVQASPRTGGGVDVRRPIPRTSSFAFGFAFNGYLSQVSRTIVVAESSSGEQLSLRQTLTGALTVNRGGVVLAESDISMLPSGQWAYLEFCATISTTTGSVRVYLNGVEVQELSLDNVNTQNQSNSDVERINLFFVSGGESIFDDLYVECDGMTPVGEGRIWTGRVNADVVAQFTSSTGADNYEAVDEVPVSATDYNASDVLGARDIFELADLDFAPSQIYGIQLTMNATKDEAGVRALKSVLKSDATEEQGSQFVLALSANNWKHDFWPLNPDTGLAWTIEDYDALQAGYEITL